MSKDDVDLSRRRFLTTTATVVGGAGVVAGVIPFVSYMSPSDRAKAAGAPVEVDISKIEPGGRITELWQGKPVWILRRTETMIKDLKGLKGEVRDPASAESDQPEYCKNELRSIKDEYLITVGICTHLGCSPTFKPEVGIKDMGGDAWKGGFFCPCHGSKFDLAGRVYKSVPAPTNLVIPKHKYLSDTVVLVGADGGNA